MSYANFKQTFWSKHIQTELGKFCVFDKFCDYKFEGEAKGGERVKILGVNRPTINTYVPGTNINREAVPDSSQFLDINQFKYFNFGVDDVDKAQSKEGLMETLTTESSVALAETFDTFVAGLVGDGTKVTKTAAITTQDLAIGAVDEAFEKLWNAGVPLNERCEIIVTPWFYNLFKGKIMDLSTDNVKLIEKGIVGYYNNAEVRVSNNIHNTGTYDNMCIRTKKGIAAVKQIDNVEAYRPEGGFEDALKGLMVYGAKVVRPKEVICLQVKRA